MNNEAIPNRLRKEQSPYLLQHAHNPVDWFPWGDEAFTKAKEEDKPIFLSIGYSTCHWCHVMARESFEDEEVAKILNKDFVSIKVDREERPDVDSIYMSVCQKLTRRGGWPLTIFMFPNQKPFFAGTYFPKKSQYGMTGLIDLLEAVAKRWKTDREAFANSSEAITKALLEEVDDKKGKSVISKDVIETGFRDLSASFDKKYGGFSKAPKFPTAHNLLFLLQYSYYDENEVALKMVEKTLNSMFQGGIFDHIGYGFSRYSTDNKWLVPHFEKMLYDNGLLTIAYLEAYQISKKEHFKRIAIKTMSYVEKELTSDQGGFYSAQDADSEGEEGKYYVFTPNEVKKVLGEEGEYFNKYYNITLQGNFEGKNIPNLLHHKAEDLFHEDWSIEKENIERMKEKLYHYRLQRTQLHKDDKLLTSWNSLMIVAFAKAYKILQEPGYLEIAKKADRFIEEKLRKKDKLLVLHRDGISKGQGHIDDYAFYIWALLELYESTFELDYLQRALHFYSVMVEDFFDEVSGGFYLYGKDSEQLIHRPKEIYDGAIPSGNSVALYCMMKLSAYTADLSLMKDLEKQLEYIFQRLVDYPSAYSFSLIGLMQKLYPRKELVCVSNKDEDKKIIQDFLAKYYLPNVTLLFKTPENSEALGEIAGFTKDYKIKDNELTFYLCENHVCMPAFHGIEELKSRL